VKFNTFQYIDWRIANKKRNRSWGFIWYHGFGGHGFPVHDFLSEQIHVGYEDFGRGVGSLCRRNGSFDWKPRFNSVYCGMWIRVEYWVPPSTGLWEESSDLE
jgi:hypothetical protein